MIGMASQIEGEDTPISQQPIMAIQEAVEQSGQQQTGKREEGEKIGDLTGNPSTSSEALKKCDGNLGDSKFSVINEAKEMIVIRNETDRGEGILGANRGEQSHLEPEAHAMEKELEFNPSSTERKISSLDTSSHVEDVAQLIVGNEANAEPSDLMHNEPRAMPTVRMRECIKITHGSTTSPANNHVYWMHIGQMEVPTSIMQDYTITSDGDALTTYLANDHVDLVGNATTETPDSATQNNAITSDGDGRTHLANDHVDLVGNATTETPDSATQNNAITSDGDGRAHLVNMNGNLIEQEVPKITTYVDNEILDVTHEDYSSMSNDLNGPTTSAIQSNPITSDGFGFMEYLAYENDDVIHEEVPDMATYHDGLENREILNVTYDDDTLMSNDPNNATNSDTENNAITISDVYGFMAYLAYEDDEDDLINEEVPSMATYQDNMAHMETLDVTYEDDNNMMNSVHNGPTTSAVQNNTIASDGSGFMAYLASLDNNTVHDDSMGASTTAAQDSTINVAAAPTNEMNELANGDNIPGLRGGSKDDSSDKDDSLPGKDDKCSHDDYDDPSDKSDPPNGNMTAGTSAAEEGNAPEDEDKNNVDLNIVYNYHDAWLEEFEKEMSSNGEPVTENYDFMYNCCEKHILAREARMNKENVKEHEENEMPDMQLINNHEANQPFPNLIEANNDDLGNNDPIGNQIDDPIEDDIDDLNDHLIDYPANFPVYDLIIYPANNPVDEPVEDPINDPVDNHIDDIIEHPVDDPVIDPVDDHIEDIIEHPVDDPVIDPDDILGDYHIDESSDESDEDDSEDSSAEEENQLPLECPPPTFNSVCCISKNTFDLPYDYSVGRGCKWSSDGECVIVGSNDQNLRIYALPDFIHEPRFWTSVTQNSVSILNEEKLTFDERITDFQWLPNLSDGYKVFISTKAKGIELWDITQEVYSTASYEMKVNTQNLYAKCMSVSMDGEYVYSAAKSWIFRHKVDRPDLAEQQAPRTDHFPKGKLSSICHSPVAPKTFAIGAYNKTIGLFDDWKLKLTFKGHDCGITYSMFSNDGNKLYTGARGTGEIICWDLRNPSEKYWILRRRVQSEQWIHFDITSCGKYFITGGTDGRVRVWNTETIYNSDAKEVSPARHFSASTDSVSGIGMHPHYPVLATVSGQYDHPHIGYYDDCLSDNIDPRIYRTTASADGQVENGIRFWWVANLV